MPEVTIHEAVQVGGKVYPPGTHELSDEAVKTLRENGRGHLIAGEAATERKPSGRRSKPAEGDDPKPAKGESKPAEGDDPKED